MITNKHERLGYEENEGKISSTRNISSQNEIAMSNWTR